MSSAGRTGGLYLLKRAHLAARSVADEALAPRGLSVAQYALLRALEAEPGLSGAELARRNYVSAPTVTGLLTTLERSGLITRVADPQGGRCLLARLTPDGHEMLRCCRLTMEWLEETLLADLGEITREQFLTALANVAHAAETVRAPAEFAPGPVATQPTAP